MNKFNEFLCITVSRGRMTNNARVKQCGVSSGNLVFVFFEIERFSLKLF